MKNKAKLTLKKKVFLNVFRRLYILKIDSSVFKVKRSNVAFTRSRVEHSYLQPNVLELNELISTKLQ